MRTTRLQTHIKYAHNNTMWRLLVSDVRLYMNTSTSSTPLTTSPPSLFPSQSFSLLTTKVQHCSLLSPCSLLPPLTMLTAPSSHHAHCSLHSPCSLLTNMFSWHIYVRTYITTYPLLSHISNFPCIYNPQQLSCSSPSPPPNPSHPFPSVSPTTHTLLLYPCYLLHSHQMKSLQ